MAQLVKTCVPAQNQFGHKPNPAMLRLAREARGLTIRQVEKLCGMKRERWFRLEIGAVVHADELVKLAEVLRKPVGFFYQTDDVYPPNLWEESCRIRKGSPVNGAT